MYDWSKNAEGGDAEKIPAGQHQVRISKIIFQKKDGTKFKTGNGDPKIMLVFSDDEAREAAQMVTLSKKAAWVLAGICKACGIDVEKMTAKGITPDRFAEEQFANAQLLGRKAFMARVSWDKGDDGKEYAEVRPLRPRPGHEAPATSPAEAEIPF